MLLENQFQNTLRSIEDLWEHLINKLCQQDILIQEKDKLIEELKRIIFVNELFENDDSQGEAGISGYFLGSSDDETSSSSLSE